MVLCFWSSSASWARLAASSCPKRSEPGPWGPGLGECSREQEVRETLSCSVLRVSKEKSVSFETEDRAERSGSAKSVRWSSSRRAHCSSSWKLKCQDWRIEEITAAGSSPSGPTASPLKMRSNLW